MGMKVIFLDWDGVMNNAIFNSQNSDDCGLILADDTGVETFCPDNVRNLNLILQNSDVKVVVSSDRRRNFDLDHLRKTFLINHVHGDIIDVTPVHKDPAISEDSAIKLRNIEINQWLAAHPEVTKFVVIDDMDLGKHGMANFVKVNFVLGITDSDAAKALEILNG